MIESVTTGAEAGRVQSTLLGSLARGEYLASGRVRNAFEFQFRRDTLGHRIHTVVAMITLAGICGPTVVAEFALLPLALYSAIRVLNVWRCWTIAALSPVGFLMLAFSVWAWLSLLWTRDLTQGVDEVLNTRWVLLPGMLWPILDQRRKLIGAIVVGMLLANAAQVVHAIGVHWNIETLRFPRMPDRNSGWWQPVVGGSMLTAALGLHLPAAVMGAGRTRLLACAGSIVTLLAILATGTRGALLASVGLVAIVMGAAVWRLVRRGSLMRARTLVPLVVALLAMVGTGAVMGPRLARRFDAAWKDLDRAIEHKDFFTDTGGRLLMGWKGIEATSEHPLAGVGIGGYRAWAVADLERQGIDPKSRNIQGHAHNAWIHISSSLGVPALLIALATLGTSLVGARHGGIDEHRREKCLGIGTYDAGPAFALIGLVLVGMFDPIITNMQTCALLCALMGLCVMPRVARNQRISHPH